MACLFNVSILFEGTIVPPGNTWTLLNNMELHEKKFEVLNYSLNPSWLLRQLPFTAECTEYLTPEGHSIQPKDTVRDLGVLISSNRSWSPHINEIAQCANKIASWVLGVFKDRSPAVMMTLFKSMVRSKLEYCCPVWKRGEVSHPQRSAGTICTFLYSTVEERMPTTRPFSAVVRRMRSKLLRPNFS